MATTPGTPTNSNGGYTSDHLVSSFHTMLTHISELLTADNASSLAYIHGLPVPPLGSAPYRPLDVLMELEKRGVFSHENVEPLIGLLTDLHHTDIINTCAIREYKEKVEQASRGGKMRKGATSPGMPTNSNGSYTSDHLVSSFRTMLMHISELLTADSAMALAYIHHFPIPPSGSAPYRPLDVLMELEKRGVFSHENIEPLISLLTDLHHVDIINTCAIREFKEKVEQASKGDRGGKMRKGATSPGMPNNSNSGYTSDHLVSSFHTMLTRISELLTADNASSLAYIHGLPVPPPGSAPHRPFDVLMELEKRGVFSHENVEPLIGLLTDLHRVDIINTCAIREYKEKVEQASKGDRGGKMRKGATSPGMPTNSNGGCTSDHLVSSFRTMLMHISELLTADSAMALAYIHDLPIPPLGSAPHRPLDVLMELEKRGVFSHENVAPLIDLLRDIRRLDIIDTCAIREFKEKVEQVSKGDRGGKTRKGATSPGMPTNSNGGYTSDHLVSSFRTMLTHISEYLRADNAKALALCGLPGPPPDSAPHRPLDVLMELEKRGVFSHENVEPLIGLLRDINRLDIIDTIQEYKDKAEQQATIEAQKILEDALKQGYILLNNFIALMVGSPGVGKTCLKCLLMGRKSPDARTSTICAEHPLKIRSVSLSQFQTLRGKWKEVSSDKLLPMIARFIRKNAKRHGVEIPPELNDYLELLEGSTTAAAAGMLDVSSTPESNSYLELLEGSITAAATGMVHVATSSTATSRLAAMAGESSSSGRSHATSSSKNEAATLDEMVESLLGSLKKLIAGEELTEGEEDELMSSVWIYFTDSGGQPQFHELLPLFIHDVSSVIIVSRLSDRLDDHPPDEYYQDGQCVGKKSSTHLTTTEQIKCLASSLLSRSSDKVPDIIVVGTHRDKADECPESIEEKNEKLLKIFGPELEPHLVFYEGMDSLFHPVNTIDPDDFDNGVAGNIRVAVEMSKLGKKVKVPIWWFILELLIQGLAKKLGKRVLSKEQCVKIANTLGFTERSFDEALKFFNGLNVIKYSSALPEVVFVDSQVPLDNLSDLVQEGYLLRHGRPTLRRGNWKRFCYEGVVTEEFMDSTCKHFEKGIFESPQLLKLLQNQLVVVPLEPLLVEVTGVDEYFMPALLDVLSREELKKHQVFSSLASPLLFRFPCGCRRAGVFCCLVVHLMKQSKWSIQHLNKKVILVARNCVTFRLPKHSCLVTLIDAFYFFEVHVAAETKASVCQEMCPIIRKEILAGIEAASEKLRYSYDRPEVGVFCRCHGDPASLPQSDRHAALVQGSGADIACTCVETSVTNALDERSTIWLGQEKTALLSSANPVESLPNEGTCTTTSSHDILEVDGSSPMAATPHPADTQAIPYLDSQVQLKYLNLIRWRDGRGEPQRFFLMENISPNWRGIGELIGLSVSLLRNIATEHRDKPLECCRAVLGHWLENPPTEYPITWRGLIELLKDSKLGQAVFELQSVLRETNLE